MWVSGAVVYIALSSISQVSSAQQSQIMLCIQIYKTEEQKKDYD